MSEPVEGDLYARVPMYVLIAFTFTSAAIISDANVRRASWKPKGSTPAFRHFVQARL